MMIRTDIASPGLSAATEIAVVLRAAGHETYFVGGAVRDMLLGKVPKDIDIATSATPEEVTCLFPEGNLVGACFGVVIVPRHGIHVEVATFRLERDYEDGRRPENVSYTDRPEIDASRRDFTVNGLYHDPETGTVIDYVGGLNDLKNGLIRTIGNAEERFREDYLRMLRAVRFAANFRFEIEPGTFEAIRRCAPLAARLSSERIRSELDRMLLGPDSSRAFRLLAETGLLSVILPEIESMRGVRQPERFHPEGDVFEHTILMLRHMVFPSSELAWAVLLHDVGKPSTFMVDESGRERFNGHAERGAEIAEAILDRLRFPNKSRDIIVDAVGKHMRFMHVPEMRKAKLMRLLADPNFPLHLELHRLDCIASHKIGTVYLHLLDAIGSREKGPALPEPLIGGADLIALGLKPGPVFKQILEAALNAQIEGTVSSREDALKLAETIRSGTANL
jgi:poly(A) polymerase